MYFSANLIRSLTKELAEEEHFDVNGLFNLIYHLRLPGDGVPWCIADVIASDACFIEEDCPFPGRLAYGVVDSALILRDLSLRYREQAKVCRQVDKVHLRLLSLNQPAKVIYDFNSRLRAMVFSVSAVTDLSNPKKEFSSLERSVLFEQIIESAIAESELTGRLVEHITKTLDRSEKNCLIKQVSITAEEGLENEPWNDEETPLLTGDTFPVTRFRLSLFKNPGFNKQVKHLTEQIKSFCR